MAINSQQQSSDHSYNASIAYLEEARSKLGKIKSQIESEQHVLGNHYQGEDGSAYGQALINWLNIMEAIRGTCMSMENVLRENQQASNRAQQHNLDQVTHAAQAAPAPNVSISQSTFSTLHPAG